MLELAILGLLKEQEQHGYELKQRLSDTLGVMSGVSFGSLYPALARLERAGAVVSVQPSGEAASIPQTGSLGGELAVFRARPAGRGRSRKVYAITGRGERLFEELLAAEPGSSEDARTFSLRVAFARYLPTDARIGMLERRRAQLLERLRRSSSRLRAGRRRIDVYLSSLMEHDREATEHDLSWIERLLATERAGVATTGASVVAAPGEAAATARSDPPMPPPSLAGVHSGARRESRAARRRSSPGTGPGADGTGRSAPPTRRRRSTAAGTSASELSAPGVDKESR